MIKLNELDIYRTIPTQREGACPKGCVSPWAAAMSAAAAAGAQSSCDQRLSAAVSLLQADRGGPVLAAQTTSLCMRPTYTTRLPDVYELKRTVPVCTFLSAMESESISFTEKTNHRNRIQCIFFLRVYFPVCKQITSKQEYQFEEALLTQLQGKLKFASVFL